MSQLQTFLPVELRVLIALQLLRADDDNNNDYLSFAIFAAFQPDIQREFKPLSRDPRYEISVRLATIEYSLMTNLLRPSFDSVASYLREMLPLLTHSTERLFHGGWSQVETSDVDNINKLIKFVQEAFNTVAAAKSQLPVIRIEIDTQGAYTLEHRYLYEDSNDVYDIRLTRLWTRHTRNTPAPALAPAAPALAVAVDMLQDELLHDDWDGVEVVEEEEEDEEEEDEDEDEEDLHDVVEHLINHPEGGYFWWKYFPDGRATGYICSGEPFQTCLRIRINDVGRCSHYDGDQSQERLVIRKYADHTEYFDGEKGQERKKRTDWFYAANQTMIHIYFDGVKKKETIVRKEYRIICDTFSALSIHSFTEFYEGDKGYERMVRKWVTDPKNGNYTVYYQGDKNKERIVRKEYMLHGRALRIVHYKGEQGSEEPFSIDNSIQRITQCGNVFELHRQQVHRQEEDVWGV
tara:strand:+ start:696 stop:2084 length:1389 start_codon:yes stop_codon:yes gene_type:complete